MNPSHLLCFNVIYQLFWWHQKHPRGSFLFEDFTYTPEILFTARLPLQNMDGFFFKRQDDALWGVQISKDSKAEATNEVPPQKNTPPMGMCNFSRKIFFLLVWKNQFGIQVKVGLEKHLHFILEKLVIFRPPNSRADIWSGQSTTGGRFLTIQFLQHMNTHTHTQMSHEGNDLRQMPDVYKNQLYIKLSLWWTQPKYLHRWMVFLRKCHKSPNRVFFVEICRL